MAIPEDGAHPEAVECGAGVSKADRSCQAAGCPESRCVAGLRRASSGLRRSTPTPMRTTPSSGQQSSTRVDEAQGSRDGMLKMK